MPDPQAKPPIARASIAMLGPADLRSSFAHLGRSGDDWIDRWDGTTLRRTARTGADSSVVPYAALVTGTLVRPLLEILWPLEQATTEVEAAVRATIVSDPPALAQLIATDQRVAALAARYPGLLPVLVADPFTALVRSISAQQVNLRWAATIRRRLAEGYGVRHEIGGGFVYSLAPAAIADTTIEALRAIQLTTSKAVSLIACSRAAAAGELERVELAALDDEALIAHLTRLPGIGRWSAEWFLARTLGRPRVVAGDLGVRKAIGRLYGTDGLPSEDTVRSLTAHWGPAATLAQSLALHDLAVAP